MMGSARNSSCRVGDRIPAELASRATGAITMLYGRWIVRILVEACPQPIRTAELCARVPEASKKMLIDGLQRLESLGFLQRTDRSAKVKHVEYEVPEALKDELSTLLGSLAQFQDVLSDVRKVEPDERT